MPAVLKAVLLAILLDARRAQSRQAMLIDRKLPGKEFVDGQSVAAAGLFEGKQAPADCGNDFGFTANNPPFGAGAGRSAIVKGLPSGPMTYFTLGRWGSVMVYSQTLNH